MKHLTGASQWLFYPNEAKQITRYQQVGRHDFPIQTMIRHKVLVPVSPATSSPSARTQAVTPEPQVTTTGLLSIPAWSKSLTNFICWFKQASLTV